MEEAQIRQVRSMGWWMISESVVDDKEMGSTLRRSSNNLCKDPMQKEHPVFTKPPD
jgi:hypothetical protein